MKNMNFFQNKKQQLNKVLLLDDDDWLNDWLYDHEEIQLEETSFLSEQKGYYHPEDLKLSFPSEWKGYYHPEDLKLKEKDSLKPFLLYYKEARFLTRFIYESNKEKGKFFGVTKIIDTGAPKSFYFGPNTQNFLKSNGNLQVYNDDGPHGNGHVIYDGLLFPVVKTPKLFKEANIVGIRAITKLGMNITKTHVHFLGMITKTEQIPEQ